MEDGVEETKISLVSSMQPKTLEKCFALDIPKFLLQAIAMQNEDFKFSSPRFSFRGLEKEKYSGYITVQFVDGDRKKGIEFMVGVFTKGYVAPQLLANMSITVEVSIRDAETGVISTLERKVFHRKMKESLQGFNGIIKIEPDNLTSSVELEDEVRVSGELVVVYTPTTSARWKEEDSSIGFSGHTTPARSIYEKHLAKKKKTDLTVVCGGEEFPVHSLVLSLVSPVFERMLETKMEEAASRRIVIDDFEPEAVGRMIDFIYKGTLFSQEETPSDESIIELLDCAEKYEIADLKKEVLHQICYRLTVNNAIKYAKAVKTFNGDYVTLTKILEFCKKNLPNFRKNSDKILLDNIEAWI